MPQTMNNKQLAEALRARGMHNNFELLNKFGDKFSLATSYSNGDRFSSPKGIERVGSPCIPRTPTNGPRNASKVLHW